MTSAFSVSPCLYALIPGFEEVVVRKFLLCIPPRGPFEHERHLQCGNKPKTNQMRKATAIYSERGTASGSASITYILAETQRQMRE